MPPFGCIGTKQEGNAAKWSTLRFFQVVSQHRAALSSCPTWRSDINST
jgi:hypothetical protein